MPHSESFRDVGKGAIIMMAGFAVGTFFQYLYKAILSRTLGPEEFGLFIQGLGISLTLGTISLLGLTETVPRYISLLEAKSEESEMKRMLSVSGSAVAAFSVVIAVFAWVFSDLIAGEIMGQPEMTEVLGLLALAVPFYAVNHLVLSWFRGYRDAMKSRVLDDFIWSGLVVAFVVAAISISRTPEAAAIGYIAATATSTIVSIVAFTKDYSLEKSFSRETITELAEFGWPLYVVTLMVIAVRYFDTLMIGRFLGSEAAGIYDIAFSISGYIGISLTAVGFMFLPAASELHAKMKSGELLNAYRNSARWSVLIALPIAAATMVFPEEIISILFGQSYIEGSNALRLLTAAFMVKVSLGPTYSLLMSKGKTKSVLKGQITITSLIVALNLLLIPIYGLEGAALSTLIAFICGNLLLFYMAARELDGFPLSWRLAKIFTLGATVFSGMAAVKHFLNPSIPASVAVGFLSLISYILVLYLAGLIPEEDIEIFRGLL